MIILEGAICPLGMITTAAQDYADLKAGKISQLEYYRRHPEEMPDAKASNILTDEEMNYKHPILERYC